MKFTIVRVNFEKIRSNTIGILILKRKIEGKLFSYQRKREELIRGVMQ